MSHRAPGTRAGAWTWRAAAGQAHWVVVERGAAARQALTPMRKKAGHTGTLDPLASGLLPLCFGEATKFAQFLLDATKRYTATVRFGVTTATGDAGGDVLATRRHAGTQ